MDPIECASTFLSAADEFLADKWEKPFELGFAEDKKHYILKK